MAFAYRQILKITTIASTAGTLYTHSTGTYAHTYIRSIIIHNANTTAELVKLYYLASGGTAGATNEFYSETLNPGDTRIIEFTPPGLMMTDNGDFIQGVTTTASKVTIQFMGGTD